MSSYVEEEGDGDEELLELCSLVEEYKEALGTVEAANVNLQAQVQKLQQENESLKETTRQQEGVIQRLDDSVNQLMEDIEQQNEIIETKNSDLQSLQHCLSKTIDVSAYLLLCLS
jgi:chromosome segregation ATPase